MAEFAMTVIGSGSALPMHGRHPSAQVVQYDDMFFLIDCGEGTQMRLRDANIKPFKIQLIFISHLHGDHVFGLPGLISSFSHLKRTEPLTVFGPKGITNFLNEIIRYSEMKVNYPLHIIESTPFNPQLIWTESNLEIFTFPLNHRIACNGYLFREKHAVLKLRKEKIQSMSLSIEQIHALQRGEDIIYNRRKIGNHEMTFGKEYPLSYAYCSDTKYDTRLVSMIRPVSVLYHETTFKNDMRVMAEETGHTTAGDAGLMAKELEAACLITGHYSSRYKFVADLLTEAEVFCPQVLEAVEGKKYNLRALAQCP